jgi:hypothetical protein
MPRERRDLTGNVTAEKASWSSEEIIVWLDNEERLQEEEDNRVQAEFEANNQRVTTKRPKEIWARIGRSYAREAEEYIL